MYIVNEQLYFPPADQADENGLLAMGGDLSTERLLLAYRSGIFPWFNDNEPILWWCPDPRFVLIPSWLKISKSMRPLLNGNRFRFTMNRAFEAVIDQCKTINRPGQQGTWITSAVKEAYIRLHQQGFALSAETWHKGELVGGLYGVRLGNIFFGESMFSTQSNASKFAFIQLVHQLQQEAVVLIDCQVYTEHLESLGAVMMHRKDFLDVLQLHC